MDKDLQQRLELARRLAREAGELALSFFRSVGDLQIKQKGTQDLVSNADIEVELFIRKRLAEAFPDDGIVGEEHASVASRSGYTWVIDPIDGTANFVRAIPAWCVVLACVHEDQTKIGVICDPCHDEIYTAALDQGAFLNDSRMHVAASGSLDDGSIGVGMNNRTPHFMVTRIIELLIARGGIFYRNASGALMLAYVAAGRLIGYSEPHMNAWDCLAGQLLVAEAGGRVEKQSADGMLEHGGRVVVGTPGVFDELVMISNEAYDSN